MPGLWEDFLEVRRPLAGILNFCRVGDGVAHGDECGLEQLILARCAVDSVGTGKPLDLIDPNLRGS